jgi:hypothetical protein
MQLKLPQEFAGPLGLETILVAILAHHGKPCDLRVWLVGMAGFEPAASCSQSRRANQAALHPVCCARLPGPGGTT